LSSTRAIVTAVVSRSLAVRTIADLVLLDDAFGKLPRAVREGQRIQSGMRDILKLFLTRVFAMGLLLVGTGIVSEFRLGPKHNALLTVPTVGIPSVALAAWARPGPALGASWLRRVFHVVLPAAVTLALVELGVHPAAYLGVADALTAAVWETATPFSALAAARSAATFVGILGGLLMVRFGESPVET
jgi:cation-transporting ATPase E